MIKLGISLKTKKKKGFLNKVVKVYSCMRIAFALSSITPLN